MLQYDYKINNDCWLLRDVINIFKTSDTHCPIASLKKKKKEDIFILPPSRRMPVSPPFLMFYFSPFFIFHSVINIYSFGRYLLNIFDSQSTVLVMRVQDQYRSGQTDKDHPIV